MFQSPQGIALGKYQPHVLQTIEEKGGKLGMLDIIASNHDLKKEIYEKTRIIAAHISSPICLEGQSMSGDEYARLMENYEKWENSGNQVYGAPVNGFHMLRGSIEGDFRSMVDVFHHQNSVFVLDWMG